MWDKNIDEGIFLCDHESHILTGKFLSSLYYIRLQLQKEWRDPNEFILDETDLVSYILITNGYYGKKLSVEVFRQSDEIILSNRQENEIFQGKSSILYELWEEELFLYKLYEPGLHFDTFCARCHNELEIWDDKCPKCIDEDCYDLDETFRAYGLVFCSECPGVTIRIGNKKVSVYCEYNILTGKRKSTYNCSDCEEHFNWLDTKFKKEKKKKRRRRRNKRKIIINKRKYKTKKR